MKRDSRTDYVVKRLERLIRLRVEYVDMVNTRGLKLIDRSIRATVTDLSDVGRAEEAAELLYRLSVRLASGGAL